MLARSLLATLATMLAATMVVLSATAQTPERSSAEAIEALDRGVNLMDSTMIWRHQLSGPNEEDIEDQYKKIREATALFMRFAGERFVTMAIEGIQYWFDDLRLHDPSVVVPRTIEEAVQECHERRDRELTAKVAATLADALEHARKDKVAEAKYGPIVDNPEYYRAIKSPMSGLDLLRNVKWAIDHDALLRIDFFTSENMKRFFGVSAVVFREIAAGESKWRSPMRRANPQTGCLYQVELSWIGDAQSASLTVDCNSSHSISPTFDDVVRTFSENWQPDPKVSPEGVHIRGLSSQGAVKGVHRPPPTGPQGYDNLIYTYVVPHFTRMLRVFLGDDANFKGLQVHVTDWP